MNTLFKSFKHIVIFQLFNLMLIYLLLSLLFVCLPGNIIDGHYFDAFISYLVIVFPSYYLFFILLLMIPMIINSFLFKNSFIKNTLKKWFFKFTLKSFIFTSVYFFILYLIVIFFDPKWSFVFSYGITSDPIMKPMIYPYASILNFLNYGIALGAKVAVIGSAVYTTIQAVSQSIIILIVCCFRLKK